MIAEGRWERGFDGEGVGICGMRAERNVEDGWGEETEHRLKPVLQGAALPSAVPRL